MHHKTTLATRSGPPIRPLFGLPTNVARPKIAVAIAAPTLINREMHGTDAPEIVRFIASHVCNRFT